MKEKLLSNILRFQGASENLEFHFYGVEIPEAEYIYHSVVPDEIKEQFQHIGTEVQELIYTDSIAYSVRTHAPEHGQFAC